MGMLSFISLLTLSAFASPNVGDFVQFTKKYEEGKWIPNPSTIKSKAIWRIDRIEKEKGVHMTLIEGKTFFSTRGLLGPGIGNLFFSNRVYRKAAKELNQERCQQILEEVEVIQESSLVSHLKEMSRKYPDVEHY